MRPASCCIELVVKCSSSESPRRAKNPCFSPVQSGRLNPPGKTMTFNVASATVPSIVHGRERRFRPQAVCQNPAARRIRRPKKPVCLAVSDIGSKWVHAYCLQIAWPDSMPNYARCITLSRQSAGARYCRSFGLGKMGGDRMEHSDFRALFGLSAFSEEQALRIYVQRQFSRIVAHGVDYDVAQRVVGRITAFDTWAPEWAGEGEYWEAVAVKARRRSHNITAMTAFFLASSCYRVAQQILHDDAAKMAYYPKVVNLFETAGKLMSPPMKRASIRSSYGSLPAYLSVPAGRGRLPAVILAGGADGWREEYLPITLIFLERGFAVLNVDAPGQGAARLFHKTAMPVDVEKFYSAAVDFLLKTPRINPRQIFMVGHSVGGYLALRTAAADRRLAACAALGAPF